MAAAIGAPNVSIRDHRLAVDGNFNTLTPLTIAATMSAHPMKALAAYQTASLDCVSEVLKP